MMHLRLPRAAVVMLLVLFASGIAAWLGIAIPPALARAGLSTAAVSPPSGTAPAALPAPEVRAPAQTPVLPPLSVRTAKFFKQNPSAWSTFLSQLPQSTGTPQATPQPGSPGPGGTWTAVTAAPSPGLCNPLLLTDGTVIVHDCNTPNWYKLTPDSGGNYATGTWSQIASLPIIGGTQYAPQYKASAVLTDGRVVVEGGEYNGTNSEVWTDLGAIYDPLNNQWTAVPAPTGWTQIGDAQSIILPNGSFLLGSCCSYPDADALFDAATLGWTATGAPTGGSYQNEQGYTLLPTDDVLTIDVWNPPNAEAYDPATGVWSAAGSTPVSLVDPTTCGTYEIGPAVTRPDGTVVAFGGNTGCTGEADPTAVYATSTGLWTAGPNVPATCGPGGTTACDLADAPGALLPDGNILFAASSGYGSSPTHFFEFTSGGAINQIADTLYFASSSGAYYYNFLVLPNGQLLETDFSNTPEVYTPSGTPNASWAPTVATVASNLTAGDTYQLSGTQLNGLSQGAAYGDDAQAATNYPIVRITNNASGHVFYARSFNPSTMSIAPNAAGSVSFTVSQAIEPGASTLSVIANGIASTPATVATSGSVYAKGADFNADGHSDLLWRNSGGTVATWEMNGGTITASVTLGASDNSWQIVGTGDFYGTGSTDLLWRNSNGNVRIWEVSGGKVIATPGIGSAPTAWQIVGTGDFNGDGKTDILWRNTNGNVAIWEMNGAQVIATAGIGSAANTWQIVGTGDFNGDGKTDILWHNTNGNVAIWEMNGTSILASASVGTAPTSWQIVGTGDFNGDGKSDILWRNTSGAVAIWEMNGTSILASASVGTAPMSWQIAGTGDFNGDGKTDILWRNTSGAVAIWEMNGLQISSSMGIGTAPTQWMLLQ